MYVCRLVPNPLYKSVMNSNICFRMSADKAWEFLPEQMAMRAFGYGEVTLHWTSGIGGFWQEGGWK